MKKRLVVHGLCLFLLAAGVLGCAAPTRYHVLCLLFDGVPVPPGMEPCDGINGAANGIAARRSKSGNESASGYVQHGPYAAKLCEGCHQRQTNKLILPVEELCLNCHVMNTAQKKNLHGPLASGGCVICHNPHGSGNKFLLVSDSRGFCLYCHKQEDILKNEVHQGTDEACTTCHNAHGSNNEYLLRDIPGQVFTRRKQAPKLTTEAPNPQEKKNKQALAPENKKAQKPNGVKSTQAEAPKNSRIIPRPEEVKNIKPQASELTTETQRPEEARNTEVQAPKNSKKAKLPEEVKNIKYQLPAPDYDREDSKTKKDKTAQISSLR